jgi:hypothetical protein
MLEGEFFFDALDAADTTPAFTTSEGTSYVKD